jgi:uncharacterized RDD family membrane protein YckC
MLIVTLIVAGVIDALGRDPTSPFQDDGGLDVRSRALWVVARVRLAAPVLGYFAYFRHAGQTPGMDVLGILVVTADGRPPGAARALVRSLLTLLFALAAYLVWLDAFGRSVTSTTPYRELYADPPELVVAAAGLAAAAWVVGIAAALVDARRRTLWDRLTGLLVVDAAEQTFRDVRYDEWLRRRRR